MNIPPHLAHLPAPSPEAQALSDELSALIAREIDAAGGWISFARYMELALYAPGLGYYSAGSRKLGEAGDFVTAPELSPLFARCIARQLAQLHGEGLRNVLEIGAGSGALASRWRAQLVTFGKNVALGSYYTQAEAGWMFDCAHRWLASQRVDARTVMCVLTHDPKFDVPVLMEALKTPAAYIGAMGSRRTHADREERLREAGASEADLARQTEGVICRKDRGVIDEIPGAYKDIDSVMANQTDLVEVVHTLKQVVCVKG